MKISDNQALWMATDAGLIKMLGDSVTIYDAEWGLNDDMLYSLSFTDEGCG